MKTPTSSPECRVALHEARLALLDANDMCRSAFQIASRIAANFSTHEMGTAFGPFADRLHESLERQHAVISAFNGYTDPTYARANRATSSTAAPPPTQRRVTMNAPASSQQLQSTLQPPAIGSPWPGQGGIYVGIARGQDGASDYHLIVASPALDAAKWRAALKWAAALEVDGHKDFALPARKEQALLFANVPELFQRDWYWSGSQHASGPNYAWSQIFSDGYQNHYHKDDEFRARAVRRLAIQ